MNGPRDDYESSYSSCRFHRLDRFQFFKLICQGEDIFELELDDLGLVVFGQF